MSDKKRLERQKELRLLNNNAYTKKYERTKKGFLVRKYRNMQSRVNGVQKLKAHLYNNLEILDREDFYRWALSSVEFHRLFKEYENNDYPMKICPSIDRVDPLKGYTIDNIRWLTHSENSRLTSRNKIIDSTKFPV